MSEPLVDAIHGIHAQLKNTPDGPDRRAIIERKRAIEAELAAMKGRKPRPREIFSGHFVAAARDLLPLATYRILIAEADKRFAAAQAQGEQ